MESWYLGRPWWIAILSLFAWLGCTALIVTLDGDSDGEQWLRALSSTLGSGFAAGFVGGGLVGWWERRERRWAQERPLLGLLHKCSAELNALLFTVQDVRANIPGTEALTLLVPPGTPPLCDLPLSEAKRAALEREIEQFDDSVLQWTIARAASDGPPDESISRFGLVRWFPGAEAVRTIQRLTMLVDQVRDYEPDAITNAELEATATSLWAAALPSDGQLPSDGLEALHVWASVLGGVKSLTGGLSDVYEGLAERTDDPVLRRELEADAKSSSAIDNTLRGNRSAVTPRR